MSDYDGILQQDSHIEDHESTERQACYVYTPAHTRKGNHESLRKRRKVFYRDRILEKTDESCFYPLLNGEEKSEFASSRARISKVSWDKQHKRLEEIIQEVNLKTVNSVVKFIENAERTNQDSESLIPVGLINAGVTAAASGTTFASIAKRVKQNEQNVIVDITASHCTNLKSTLKHIIRFTTIDKNLQDGDESLRNAQQGKRLPNYDLQLLHDAVQENSFSHVIIFFKNSESVDGIILAELIEILSLWKDRIPFVLLFEIASSMDMFQEKLPRTTVRCIQGKAFETADASDTLELLFQTLTSPDRQFPLCFGPNLCGMFFDRQREYQQSAAAFMQGLKYSYMTYFFSNPLSILLDHSQNLQPLQKGHLTAIRELTSFKRLVTQLEDGKQATKARRICEDDNFLKKISYEMLHEGQKVLRELLEALELIYQIHRYQLTKSRVPWSKIYMKGMSGELIDSSIVQEMLSLIQKMPSDQLADILDQIGNLEALGVSDIQRDLCKLTASIKNNKTPLRSEYDVSRETLRTTVVAQKVELSKHRSALSREDTEYSKIISRVHSAFKTFLDHRLVPPKDLFLHEVLIYDTKTPCRNNFSPLPRYAVERALSVPHDYLDFDDDGEMEDALSSSQPATAILYQLYLESGALINIADLWSAFHAILGSEQVDDDGRDPHVLALFYRAIAELKYLGMIKSSKKKVDHLMKLSWKGL